VPAPAAEEPVAEPAEPQGNVHGITYTPAEITSLIARAQKDSGNGNYDRAILEFRTVLNQDPSNAEAKQGLARALYNQSHR
jgi:Flp pilus assembly protein TadD